MSTTWILLADGARARLLAYDPRRREIDPDFEEDFAGSTAQSRDIASDRQGRTFDRGGEGRHGMERPTDPQRYAEYAFARDLVHRLEQGANQGRFDQLALIAAPQTLGDLRGLLPKSLQQKVVIEVDKDLVRLSIHELRTRLPKMLSNP